MKICFFLHRFPELSQTFVLNQVLWFLERGHDVEVIAARPGKQGHLHGAAADVNDRLTLRHRILYTRMPESPIARAVSASWPLLRTALMRPAALATALNVRAYGWFALTGSLLHSARPLLDTPRDYDAIVAHFGPEGVVANALRRMKLLSGPLVTFFHGYDLTLAPRRLGHGVYRTLFRDGDRCLAISDHGARILLELGANPARTSIHHMGINVERFRGDRSRRSPGNQLRVLSIGRLVEKKGFAAGLDAIADAVSNGVAIDYRIIGDGPEREHLDQRIHDLGLEAVVRLTGAAGEDEVAQALAQADVLFAPSITTQDGDHEGIPMVLMEAMAAGLPVVASAHGGIPELVQHGVSGLLVAEGDSAAVAAALGRLAGDPEARLRMGRQGGERVARDFNAVVQNSRLEVLLSELHHGRIPGHS